MEQISNPPIIQEYHELGGSSLFSFWSDIDGSMGVVRKAIVEHMARMPDTNPGRYFVEVEDAYAYINADVLEGIEPVSLNIREFFGRWYDFNRGLLVEQGYWEFADGSRIENTPLVDLPKYATKSQKAGGFDCPEIECRGNYAYAFSNAVHGPNHFKHGPRFQEIFDLLNEQIFPSGYSPTVDQAALRINSTPVVYDWSTPELERFSRFFEAGLEWWGIFLFTVHDPLTSRLAVISASETD
ncbi:hypothetical protein [Parasphingopyxis sp.]|uniref:hypothetical protein n=1 Tax=Parasphingopyxis sp. TaxID=1920299 RepID=UPI002629032C|nr:hypothetical protein [Parasphingopyxis sp.]